MLFPMVLQIVNVELAGDKSREAPARQELDVYLRTIRLLSTRHDHSGYAAQITSKCLQYFRRVRELSPISSKNELPSSYNWTDISISQPAIYLRLAAYLDLSLARGRPPEENDVCDYLHLPQDIQLDIDVEFLNSEGPSTGMNDPTLPSLLQTMEPNGVLSDWDGYRDMDTADYAYESADVNYHG